jgi:hypothetical protein
LLATSEEKSNLIAGKTVLLQNATGQPTEQTKQIPRKSKKPSKEKETHLPAVSCAPTTMDQC